MKTKILLLVAILFTVTAYGKPSESYSSPFDNIRPNEAKKTASVARYSEKMPTDKNFYRI